MREKSLNPEGKVELAGLLLQIGFKPEAIAEFLMAASMYEERGEVEKATKLYEKILELEPGNAEAERGMYRLKPRSESQIDDIVSKMGFSSPVASAPTASPSVPEAKIEPKTVQPAQPPPQVPEKITEKVYEQPADATVPEPVVQKSPDEKQVVEDVELRFSEDIAGKRIEEFLASTNRILADIPDDLKQRDELSGFFAKEHLWEDAFFEGRASYLASPSVEKLNELMALMENSEARDMLITFLLTETYSERTKELQIAIFENLIKTYEKEGLADKAQEARERLSELTGQSSIKKTGNVKIVGDTPKLSEKIKVNKNKSGPIQFI